MRIRLLAPLAAIALSTGCMTVAIGMAARGDAEHHNAALDEKRDATAQKQRRSVAGATARGAAVGLLVDVAIFAVQAATGISE